MACSVAAQRQRAPDYFMEHVPAKKMERLGGTLGVDNVFIIRRRARIRRPCGIYMEAMLIWTIATFGANRGRGGVLRLTTFKALRADLAGKRLHVPSNSACSVCICWSFVVGQWATHKCSELGLEVGRSCCVSCP